MGAGGKPTESGRPGLEFGATDNGQEARVQGVWAKRTGQERAEGMARGGECERPGRRLAGERRV